MKNLVLITIIFVSSLFAIQAVIAQPVYAQADASSQQACNAIKSINPNGTGCGASNNQVSRLIRVTLQLLSIIAGIIAVIMIIISGLKYITSQGDANAISSAKKSLIYAIVGIVIVAFAQIIVQFVLRRAA